MNKYIFLFFSVFIGRCVCMDDLNYIKSIKRGLWWRSRIYGFMGLCNMSLYDKIIAILDSYIKRKEGGGK